VLMLVLSMVFSFTACSDEQATEVPTEEPGATTDEGKDDGDAVKPEDKVDETTKPEDKVDETPKPEDKVEETPKPEDKVEEPTKPSTEKEMIIGTWKSELKYGELLSEAMGLMDTTTMPADLDFSAFTKLTLPLVFTFAEDGVVTLSIPESDAATFIAEFEKANGPIVLEEKDD